MALTNSLYKCSERCDLFLELSKLKKAGENLISVSRSVYLGLVISDYGFTFCPLGPQGIRMTWKCSSPKWRVEGPHGSKEETHTGLERSQGSQQGLLAVNLLSTTSGDGRVESCLPSSTASAVWVGASALVILCIDYHGLCYNFSVLINAFFPESIKAKLFGAKNLHQQLSSQGHFCGFANPMG